MQRVGSLPGQRTAPVRPHIPLAPLPDAHHRQGEVRRNDVQAGHLPLRLEGNVAGAGGDVEQPRAGTQRRLLHDITPPAPILAEGHQPVHQVIAPRDTCEHVLHVGGVVSMGSSMRVHRSGKLSVPHQVRGCCVWAAIVPDFAARALALFSHPAKISYTE